METSQTNLSHQFQEALRPAKHVAKLILRPNFRREEQERQVAFDEFKRDTASLWRDVPAWPAPDKTALVVSGGFLEMVKIELAFIESLRMAGFAPVVLLWRDSRWVRKYYRQWGVDQFVYWDDFLPQRILPGDLPTLGNFEDVLAFKVEKMRVGKWVASWVMRLLRLGSFDPHDAEAWQTLMKKLPEGIRYARAAAAILKTISPHVAIFIERAYTPWGQLYDCCLHEEVDVIQWVGAHRNNVIMFKRYNPGNETIHPTSLSSASWEYVKRMPWNGAKAEAVKDELFRDYRSGEWGSKMGAQINKRMLNREELQSLLSLDPRKKTAVLFPHLFWDATFFYGRDLFRDYEDWFVQSVRVAVNNHALNWVIKLHPANVAKRHRDGYKGEYSEIIAIQKYIGVLPDHIKLISAESDISTFSFYSVMDYCLTVRGTVGIEAGVFGIPVLTAGTGRYDHLGFTIDSETPEEYLERLAHLQDLPPLTKKQQELAQRFAYGILMMRPFPLKSVSLEYERNARAADHVGFHVRTLRELVEAEDMQGFRRWVSNSTAEDWLSES